MDSFEAKAGAARTTVVIAAGFAAAALVGFYFGGGGAPVAGVAIAAVAAAGLVALRLPEVGLIGLIVVTFANVSDNLITYMGLPSINMLLAPGLAALLLARWVVAQERPVAPWPALGALAAWSALQFGSMLVATRWELSVERGIDVLKDSTIIALTLCFVGRPGGFRAYTNAALGVMVAICALGVYKYTLGDIDFDYYGFARAAYVEARFTGPLPDANFFGALLVLVAPLAYHRALLGDGALERAYGATAALLILAALILTSSRGGLVALVASGGLFLLTLDRRTAVMVTAVGVAVAMAAASMLTEELADRFASIFAAQEAGVRDIAVEGRLGSWKVAIHLFRENLWFGVGANNYDQLFQNTALNLDLIFRGEGRSAHSLYLEIAAEFGLLGLTLFGLMLLGSARGVLRAMAMFRQAGDRRGAAEVAAFGVGLAGYFLAMVFLHNAFPRIMWTALGIGLILPAVAGATLSARNRAAPQQNPERLRLTFPKPKA